MYPGFGIVGVEGFHWRLSFGRWLLVFYAAEPKPMDHNNRKINYSPPRSP